MADSDSIIQFNAANKSLANISKSMSQIASAASSFGTFTLSAAATKTVSDAKATANSYPLCFPLNAGAATLQSGAHSLYISARAAGSFTVATADGGNAPGGEQFLYVIYNPTV